MILDKITKIDNSYASICFDAMITINSKLERMQNTDGDIEEQNYILQLASSIGKKIEETIFLQGGELKKEISLSNKAVQDLVRRLRKTCIDDNLSDVTVKPDYAIHYSAKRENLTQETQKMVIEAKTASYISQDAFSWDLYKLGAYVNELSYQSAIYLIINTDKKRVEELLKGYEEQGLPDIKVPYGHILFFIQDSIKSDPNAFVLRDE